VRLSSLVGFFVGAAVICLAVASKGPETPKAASAKKAKLLATAALNYAYDWDGLMPWVQNQTIVRIGINAYAEGLEKPPSKHPLEDLFSALSKMDEAPPKGPNEPPPQPWRELRASNPRGGEFLFNLRIGGVNIDKLGASKKSAILFYDSKAWPDGSRTVAFADGHVVQVSRSKWRSVRKSLSTRYRREARKPLPKRWGF